MNLEMELPILSMGHSIVGRCKSSRNFFETLPEQVTCVSTCSMNVHLNIARTAFFTSTLKMKYRNGLIPQLTTHSTLMTMVAVIVGITDDAYQNDIW